MSTAPELESLREIGMLPPIEDFFALLDRIAAENPKAMELVGGNILIGIRDVATVTIITRGANKGVHQGALDVDVAFALICEEWVLLDLLDADVKTDLKPLIDEDFLFVQGDVDVWDRYLELGEQKSLLSVRAGNAMPTNAPKKAALRRLI